VESLAFVEVDTVCMNQDDKKEREQQVSIMHLIYSSAHKVVVWLGLAEENSDEALRWLNTLARLSWALMMGKKDVVPPHVSEFIQALLRRPWFTRVCVAPEVLVQCGSKIIGLNAFVLGCRLGGVYGNIESQLPNGHYDGGSAIWHARNFYTSRSTPRKDSTAEPLRSYGNFLQSFAALALKDEEGNQLSTFPEGYNLGHELAQGFEERHPGGVSEDYNKLFHPTENKTDLNLLNLLETFRSFNATDQRDKIYSLYNLGKLASKPIQIEPNYSLTVSGVFRETAFQILSTSGNLDALSIPLIQAPPFPDLPSWAPDWSTVDQNAAPVSLLSFVIRSQGVTFNATQGSSSSPFRSVTG
jgi:hypothetical protein